MTSSDTGSGQSAPTVVALIRDLFFSIKVRNELGAAGYETVIVKREPELLSSVESLSPALVLIDLTTRPDWDTLLILREGLPDDRLRVPILAFGPHKDVDSRRAAQAFGVDRVATNQQLHRDLAGFVRRYAREV